LWEKTTDSYLCVGCGYTTQSSLAITEDGLSSDGLVAAMATSPRLVQDLAYRDTERRLVWFPTVMNIPKVGVLYPDGKVGEWSWVVAPFIKLSEDEVEQYEMNGGDVKYEYRLGIERLQRFTGLDFESALKYLHGLIQESTV